MHSAWASLKSAWSEVLANLRKIFNDWLEHLLKSVSKALAFMNQFHLDLQSQLSERQKLHNTNALLKKSSEEYFDHIEQDYTSTFESYLLEFDYQEAHQLLQNPKVLLSIKSSLLIAYFDRLLESNNIRICFDFFRNLVLNRPAILTKSNVKKLLGFAVKTGNKSLCRDFISNLTESSDLKNQMDLYFRINQYFISFLFKANEYTLANETFTHLKQLFPFDESENALFYYKIYEIMIRGCLSKQVAKVDDAKFLVTEIAAKKPNEIFFNKLISFSSKSCEISFAEYTFKVMISSEIKPSIVTYNTLIDSYFKQNRANQAWMIFELLKKTDTIPDNFTYTTMINGLKSIANPDIEKAFVLFAEYKQLNKPDHIIYNCLLDACINAKDLSRAHELYTEMKQDPSIKLDEITYNTLIKGCCRSRKLSQAVSYYQEMKKNGIHPNRITYNSLIDNCVKANGMREAWQFYDEMYHAKIIPDIFTYSILLNGIKSNPTSKNDLYKALDLMNHVQSNPEFKPDEILYNSLIDTCIKFNEVNRGFSLFDEMKRKRIEPSPVTYGILIKAYGKSNDLVKAFEMFEQMKNKKMKINEVAYGCLLDACIKNDRMDLAIILFESMTKDNISFNTVHYTTMIKGYSKSGNFDEALRTFYKMRESVKTQPNLITYNCMIDACVKADDMAKAIELLNELLSTSSKLIPDLITFSTLIKGLCIRKEAETAHYYLGVMRDVGIKADEALFNQVLESSFSANSYELGLKVFELMQQIGVQPSNITFSIMIRLHSRAHKLQKVIEVLDIMRSYRIRPSLIIFTNVIQACFKANRIDKVLEMTAELEMTRLKWDAIFYSKLISGFLNFNQIEAALGYCERSMSDKILLGQEIYNQLTSSLQSSNLPDKFEMIGKIQSFAKYCTNGQQSGMVQGQKMNNYSHGVNKNNYFNGPSGRGNARGEEEKENQNVNTLQRKSYLHKPSDQKKDQFYPKMGDQMFSGFNGNQDISYLFLPQTKSTFQNFGTLPQSNNSFSGTFQATTERNPKPTQATKKPLKLGNKEFIVELK